MKKIVFLCITSIVFLFGMSKSNNVVPFLQPIIKDLEIKTDVPLLFPTYWTDLSKYSDPFPNVRYEANKKDYTLYFLTMDRIYPPNDPQLQYISESNKFGLFEGKIGEFKSLKKQKNYIPTKSIEGIQLWLEPKFKISLYGKYKNWAFITEGMGSNTASTEITVQLIKEMKQLNWLKDKDIVKGNIFITRNASSGKIIVTWQSKKGFVYEFESKASIRETLKIINSMKYIN
jgi:hypothetical protein